MVYSSRMYVCGVLQDSGAHIKVYVQCCPHSTEKVIQVSGQKDQVVTCIGFIMEDLIEVGSYS